MMSYFFDLDGTLIDSSARHYLLMEALLKDDGICVPCDFSADFMKYKADGFSGKMYLIEKMGLSKEHADKLQIRWVSQIENNNWLMYDKLYDDARNILEKIHNSDIYYLTSRMNNEGLKDEIDRLDISKYIKECIVVDPRNLYETKTDILKKYSDKYQGNCIMIGDTEVDYNAAIKCNIKYYILNRGFRSKKFWNEKGIVSYQDLNYLKV